VHNSTQVKQGTGQPCVAKRITLPRQPERALPFITVEYMCDIQTTYGMATTAAAEENINNIIEDSSEDEVSNV
jgi:hypothetical protein